MWKLNLTFHFPEKPVKRHYGYGRYGGSRYGGSRYGGSRYGGSRYGGYRSRYYGKKWTVSGSLSSSTPTWNCFKFGNRILNVSLL